ncbi:MAG: SPOR domain-containing protein [Nitrococcus mobilis]|nr:SPOR domain-containing protein [Nitrococcus mobilis]
MNHASNPIPFDEQQLTQLGLLHPPFTAEDFQFEDADIEAARNLAVHLLQSSNRVVILSGPAGVGRTAFLRQIAAMDPDELDCCVLDGSPQLHVVNIVKMLAMRMGASEVAHDPDTLAARLRQAEASGYRPALLIDDAHRLEENMIKGLLLLREALAKVGARLPILLAAPTGADNTLRQLTAALAEQDERSEIVLPAFTEAQTASYIEQSLAAAGEHTGELLSIRQKQQIHEQTGGIAALINQETTRLLSDTARKRNPARPSLRRSRRLYAGVAAGVILLAGGLLLTRYLTTTTESPEGMPLALPSHPASAPADPLAQAGGVGTDKAATLSDQPLTARPESPSAPEKAPAPGVGSAPSAAAPTFVQKSDAEPEQAAPQTDPPTPTPDRSNQRQEAENPTNVAMRSPAPTVASKLREDWLAGRAGDHYTIQLIAGHQKQTLERFLEQHPLVEGKTHVVQARRQGRAWHVLITGDYPSREAARNALRRLPRALRDNGSWVRSFASLRS